MPRERVKGLLDESVEQAVNIPSYVRSGARQATTEYVKP